MIVSHVVLKNWRNFQKVDVDLKARTFLVGANASGKSNFLDVFRFLHDIAKPGGGLQEAVRRRGGLSKIRCLSARRNPNVEIEVWLSDSASREILWRYAIGIQQEIRGYRNLLLSYEKVWHKDVQIVNRPDDGDKQDQIRLTQTYLEQLNANKNFREIADFLNGISYLHLIPQLLRYPETFSGANIPDDPFGRNLLERLARTSEKICKPRLKKIEAALRLAVPQLKELTRTKDERGIPHLEAVYKHWRAKGAKQREDQFSDGTLRLIGLLWSLLESDSLLLLEEPELSLNSSIVNKLPNLIYRLQREKKRQIVLSTHSADLLSTNQIGAEEVLLLIPEEEGTEVKVASSIEEIPLLLKGGQTIAEAVFPRTSPPEIDKLQYEFNFPKERKNDPH